MTFLYIFCCLLVLMEVVIFVGNQVTLRLNDKEHQQTLSGVVKFSDVAFTRMVLGSSESAITVDNSKVHGENLKSSCAKIKQINKLFEKSFLLPGFPYKNDLLIIHFLLFQLFQDVYPSLKLMGLLCH